MISIPSCARAYPSHTSYCYCGNCSKRFVPFEAPLDLRVRYFARAIHIPLYLAVTFEILARIFAAKASPPARMPTPDPIATIFSSYWQTSPGSFSLLHLR